MIPFLGFFVELRLELPGDATAVTVSGLLPSGTQHPGYPSSLALGRHAGGTDIFGVAWTDCAADCALPQDGVVNVSDLLAALGVWGAAGGCGPCDTNGDGVVDVTDLLQILGDWGPCP